MHKTFEGKQKQRKDISRSELRQSVKTLEIRIAEALADFYAVTGIPLAMPTDKPNAEKFEVNFGMRLPGDPLQSDHYVFFCKVFAYLKEPIEW